jgi:hypothetical protein
MRNLSTGFVVSPEEAVHITKLEHNDQWRQAKAFVERKRRKEAGVIVVRDPVALNPLEDKLGGFFMPRC